MTKGIKVSEWWKGAIVYQIYPRSFCDSNGDGIGDLKGITSRLDYVASLGVDAIWISPFFTSPMHDFGYDVADFYDVDPIFGSIDDFDALIAKAHRLGIKVIIDQVYSHTSMECSWFKESRQSTDNEKSDWYVWADAKPDGSPPNNWQSVFSGASWTWDATRKQYYLHNFLSQQPDLNLHNQAVQEELFRVAKFWLDKGVDGFRLDATNFYMHNPELTDNPPLENPGGTRPFDFQLQVHNQSHPDIVDFIERLRALIESYPNRFTVAEVGGHRSLEEMALYTAGNNRLNTAYSFVFLEAPDLKASVIRGAIENWEEVATSWPSWTFSNHDRPRAVTRWGTGRDRRAFSKMLNAMLVSLKGTAFLYQGEELGLPQARVPFDRLVDPEAIANWPETLGRDGTRTPHPWNTDCPSAGWSSDAWLPVDDAHVKLNVEAQEADKLSTLHATRRLLKLRKTLPSLIEGSIEFLGTSENMLAYIRKHENEQVLCVLNLSDQSCDFTSSALKDAESLYAEDAELTPTCVKLGTYGHAFLRLN